MSWIAKDHVRFNSISSFWVFQLNFILLAQLIYEIQSFSGCYNDPLGSGSSSYEGGTLTIYPNQVNCTGASNVITTSCSLQITPGSNYSAMLVSSIPDGQYGFSGNYPSNDSTCSGPSIPQAGNPFPFLNFYVVLNQCIQNGVGNATYSYAQVNSSMAVEQSGTNCNNTVNSYIQFGCTSYSNYNNETISGYSSTTVITISQTTTGSSTTESSGSMTGSSGSTTGGNSPSSSANSCLSPSSFIFFLLFCLLMYWKVCWSNFQNLGKWNTHIFKQVHFVSF